MTAPISNFPSIALPQAIQPVVGAGKPGEFQNILANTINNIQSWQNDANNAVQSFLSGQNEELHTTVLATQKAELAFQLGLQVRNKVVDAYQEVMKMQI